MTTAKSPIRSRGFREGSEGRFETPERLANRLQITPGNGLRERLTNEVDIGRPRRHALLYPGEERFIGADAAART